MAYVYKIMRILLCSIISKLQNDEHIAWIAWKEKDMIQVISGDQGGEFQFKPDGDFRDIYNQDWTIKEIAPILDLVINNNKQIWGLSRWISKVACTLHSQKGDFLIVNARTWIRIYWRKFSGTYRVEISPWFDA